jgi:methylglutaconyl-CoA hydratase
MHYSLLTLDIDKRGVAKVCLNRPDVHNAFDDRLISELTHAFGALEANDKVRFAVLLGKGKSFCAGADLNWMKAMKHYTQEENLADSSRMAEMFALLRYFTKPLICIVQGAALGGGAGLVAVCDYALAAEEAKFGLTEVRLGLIPAVISPYVIEKIGLSAARAYFTSGMMFSAQAAREMGLVHRTVARESLEKASEEVIEEFLKAGPYASRRAKALIAEVMHFSSEDREARTKHTVDAIAQMRVSEEGQEGMEALLGGHKPSWAGNA